MNEDVTGIKSVVTGTAEGSRYKLLQYKQVLESHNVVSNNSIATFFLWGQV